VQYDIAGVKSGEHPRRRLHDPTHTDDGNLLGKNETGDVFVRNRLVSGGSAGAGMTAVRPHHSCGGKANTVERSPRELVPHIANPRAFTD
jgi:hypothetical protein